MWNVGDRMLVGARMGGVCRAWWSSSRACKWFERSRAGADDPQRSSCSGVRIRTVLRRDALCPERLCLVSEFNVHRCRSEPGR